MNQAEANLIFKQYLEENRHFLVNYLTKILENKNHQFWSADEAAKIKGLYFPYFSKYYYLMCVSWDEDMEECEEVMETSFFVEDYNIAKNRPEDTDFAPESLAAFLPNSDFDEIFEAWFTACWLEVNQKPDLLGFISWMDCAYYTCMNSGEKGDHIFVQDLLNPDAAEMDW
jgi:hypothetical protein